MEAIRTLGLYQPFASLMMHGKIETRWIRKGRKPPFPKGAYLLYSTKKAYTPHQTAVVAGNQYQRIKDIMATDDSFKLKGMALCVGELYKIIYVVPGMDDQTFVHYRTDTTHVMVGLMFRNVRRIKPYPFKGKQGVGILTAEERAKIEFT